MQVRLLHRRRQRLVNALTLSPLPPGHDVAPRPHPSLTNQMHRLLLFHIPELAPLTRLQHRFRVRRAAAQRPPRRRHRHHQVLSGIVSATPASLFAPVLTCFPFASQLWHCLVLLLILLQPPPPRSPRRRSCGLGWRQQRHLDCLPLDRHVCVVSAHCLQYVRRAALLTSHVSGLGGEAAACGEMAHYFDTRCICSPYSFSPNKINANHTS